MATMTLEADEPPIWWGKFWRAISHLICEALWIFNLPLPGRRLRMEYGTVADVWCCHVHSAFETYVWEREGYPVKRTKAAPKERKEAV